MKKIVPLVFEHVVLLVNHNLKFFKRLTNMQNYYNNVDCFQIDERRIEFKIVKRDKTSNQLNDVQALTSEELKLRVFSRR